MKKGNINLRGADLRGKNHAESRLNAARVLFAAGDTDGAFMIRPLDAEYNAVLTGRDLAREREAKKTRRLEVIA